MASLRKLWVNFIFITIIVMTSTMCPYVSFDSILFKNNIQVLFVIFHVIAFEIYSIIMTWSSFIVYPIGMDVFLNCLPCCTEHKKALVDQVLPLLILISEWSSCQKHVLILFNKTDYFYSNVHSLCTCVILNIL